MVADQSDAVCAAVFAAAAVIGVTWTVQSVASSGFIISLDLTVGASWQPFRLWRSSPIALRSELGHGRFRLLRFDRDVLVEHPTMARLCHVLLAALLILDVASSVRAQPASNDAAAAEIGSALEQWRLDFSAQGGPHLRSVRAGTALRFPSFLMERPH